MKRKLFSIVLAILSCFIFVFGFSACGNESDGNSMTITSVTLNSKTLDLEVGESRTLVATVVLTVGGIEMTVVAGTPNAAIDITVDWKSLDETVVSVDNGELTALKEGSADISATVGETSAICTVRVTPAKTEEPPVEEGDPLDFVMPEGGFDTTQQVTITFYHAMGGYYLREVLDDCIGEFNKLYPNITVKHSTIGGYDDVRDAVMSGIMQGTQPNIAYCYPDHVANFNLTNAVQPLNAFLSGGEYNDMTVTQADGKAVSLGFTGEEQDDFVDSFFNEGFLYGDGSTMYSLPFAKSTEVMYYNKTFFENNNLKVPATWAEMWEVCARIKQIDSSLIPLGYDSEANWFITMCEQYESAYTSATGDNFLFDNEKNREFVGELKEQYDKGYFITQSTNTGSYYTSSLFTEGRCVMSIGSTAGASYQDPGISNGSSGFEVGMASVPQVNPENPKVILQGPSLCIFKQGDPQEVIASWLFAKYLTTNVEFQARFSEMSGYMPVIKSVFSNPVYQEYLSKAGLPARATLSCKEMTDSCAVFTSPVFFGSAKARDEVGNLIVDVFKGDKTIQEAFEYAVEQCKNYKD